MNESGLEEVTPKVFTEKLAIRGVGFPVTEAIRQHIVVNADRLFRHTTSIERMFYFLDLCQRSNGTREYRVQVRMAVPGPDIAVEVRGDNLYHTITRVSHILDRQLRRRSRKERTRLKQARSLPNLESVAA
jgi:ribosomal subunit interface protein